MNLTFLRRLALLALALLAISSASAAGALVQREWQVDGVPREALLHIPAKAATAQTPVVFAFHGHGGSMRNAARMCHVETLWPEALVIYPQGLNTPGRLTDPEGKKPGWQSAAGDQGDRDLKFFDAMLASLSAEYRVDAKRVYSTGHSNGGQFTYLLWAERGAPLAAVAPSAAVAPRPISALKPKPILHVAGENDPLVKYAWQQQMIDVLRRVNQCGESKPWDKLCTIYESSVGAPVVTFIHPGTHKYPGEAPALIVRFFKEHALP
jgi:polyhydroxybutyrate depolymerase